MAEKINDNLIYTKKFGVIWLKDYNNPEFSFLKRDIGIPYIAEETTIEKEIVKTDAFGKKYKSKEPIKIKETRIAPEYFKWQKLDKNRKYAQSQEGESFKNLTDKELQEMDIIPQKSWNDLAD